MITRACPTCRVQYAMPTALYESAKLTGLKWFCPNGHPLCFPKKAPDAPGRLLDLQGQVDTLTARNGVLEARVKALEADCACALDLAEAECDARQQLQHRLSSARSRARIIRRERHAGNCPWCHQHFDNLQRHLAAKHQGFMEAQRSIA